VGSETSAQKGMTNQGVQSRQIGNYLGIQPKWDQTNPQFLPVALWLYFKELNRFQRGNLMTKYKMKRYCVQQRPNYKLDDGVRCLESGSLQFNTILQLVLFCIEKCWCFCDFV